MGAVNSIIIRQENAVRGANLHASGDVAFRAKALVVDLEDGTDPSRHSFISLDVLSNRRLTRWDGRLVEPVELFSFHVNRDAAEHLVHQLQRAIAELPKPRPRGPRLVHA